MVQVLLTSLAPRLVVALVLLGASACEGGGSVRLRLDLAGRSDGVCDDSFRGEAPCTSVRVWRRDADGTLTPLPITALTDEAEPSIEHRTSSRSLEFDVEFGSEVTERRADLLVRVYGSDNNPLAGARVEDVDWGAQADVTVRLYPYGQWSCPGQHQQSSLEPRAFHHAVLLDDGNVLIFGGIAGENVDPASVRTDMTRAGATLQRVVELYDPRTHEFRRVPTTDRDGAAGFGRVFSGAIYLGSQDGRHRIRVIGGYALSDAGSANVAVRFDNRGTFGGPLGSPITSQDDTRTGLAEIGRTVDLEFDGQSVVVTDAEGGVAVPRGALVEVSRPLGDAAERAILIGLSGSATGSPWAPAPGAYSVDGAGETGGSYMLAHPRLGASVEPLSALDAFFIWGGNAGTLTPDLTAGEIHAADGSISTSLDTSILPPPTAFHSSTAIADGFFVVAGGYLIGADGNISFVPPSPALYLIQVQGMDSAVARMIDGGGYVSTIFHGATLLKGQGVILTGGASVVSENRLVPQAQVGIVRDSQYVPLQPLAYPRFGHSATVLPGNRLLVLGGFGPGETGSAVSAERRAEMLYYEPPPAPIIAGNCLDIPFGDGGVADTGVDAPGDTLPPILDSAPADTGAVDTGRLDARDSSAPDGG